MGTESRTPAPSVRPPSLTPPLLISYGGAVDEDANRSGKSVVIRTSTRQTIFLPVPGLIKASELTPGDLIGTNKVRPGGRRSPARPTHRSAAAMTTNFNRYLRA